MRLSCSFVRDTYPAGKGVPLLTCLVVYYPLLLCEWIWRLFYKVKCLLILAVACRPTVELLASEPPSCFCGLALEVSLQRDRLANPLSLYALL